MHTCPPARTRPPAPDRAPLFQLMLLPSSTTRRFSSPRADTAFMGHACGRRSTSPSLAASRVTPRSASAPRGRSPRGRSDTDGDAGELHARQRGDASARGWSPARSPPHNVRGTGALSSPSSRGSVRSACSPQRAACSSAAAHPSPPSPGSGFSVVRDVRRESAAAAEVVRAFTHGGVDAALDRATGRFPVTAVEPQIRVTITRPPNVTTLGSSTA